jgi:acyl-CoA thioesterase-2
VPIERPARYHHALFAVGNPFMRALEMHPALKDLLAALELADLGDHVYEGRGQGALGSHLFGGLVLAQGLAAAHRESPGARANSLHACFLHRGNTCDPIRYGVERLRRSRTFTTYQVVARQGGQAVLQMIVSYHDREAGLRHQIPMDPVGPPAGETYERALLRAMTPDAQRDPAEDAVPFELPVEIRGVATLALFSDEVQPPRAHCWMRVRGALPDDPALHQCLFAYASDYAMMAPVLHPHPLPLTMLRTASLDHALWFHRDFRIDDWVLLELDSPVAADARGIGRGLLYTREGDLVASCVQEGLIRPLVAGETQRREIRELRR